MPASSSDGPESRSNRLPRVTGIRHWSTPDYTRVAIDLENEVKFFSQRIDNPDRIFFDLRDTKLASTLVGKSFDVDDGFLKKIRVAQFQPGRTRVVLEVDDLSDYDAFLLPNPYRLIIDIHGKDIHGKDTKAARAKLPKDASTADVEVAPKAGSSAGGAITSKDAPVEMAQNGDDSDADSVPAPTAPVATPASQDSARPPGKKNWRRQGSVRTVVDPKTGVKKVIVDADDDDDSTPVQVAKLAPSSMERNRSGSSAAPLKATRDDGTTDANSSAEREKATVSDAEDGPATGKPAARIASGAKTSDKAADLDVHEARPTAGGDRSLIRALGLKIGKIVIDPGHGGHDTGTIGPNGLEEKDLVLDVGRKLGKLLETRLGAEVVYTRKDDTFIPLETRTAIANQHQADLFISIHANSSQDPSARGVDEDEELSFVLRGAVGGW